MRMVLLGCKSPKLKHVVSHRRQVFMVLKDSTEDLNLSLSFKLDGFNYMVFVSSETTCFSCGAEEHLIRSCPERTKERPITAPVAPAVLADPAAPVASAVPAIPGAMVALTPVATALGVSNNPGSAVANVSGLSGQTEEVDTQKLKNEQRECKNRVSVFNGEMSVCEEGLEDEGMSDDDWSKLSHKRTFSEPAQCRAKTFRGKRGGKDSVDSENNLSQTQQGKQGVTLLLK